MRDSYGETTAAIQVMCLGASGGPSEDGVTGFLVRSTAMEWAKGSLLAVDAGAHLAAITRILQNDFPLYAKHVASPTATHHKTPAFPPGESPSPRSLLASPNLQDQQYDEAMSSSPSSSRQSSPRPTPITTLSSGPFAGLPFPNASARANAAYVVRDFVSAYLITHPHLDHNSAFVINTAAFHNITRPKKLAALPFTVNAMKTHMFNDVIWPNLTDEDGGVGFVTFQRLAEGGNIHLGEGHGRGYIEVCDGLQVKGYKVSHGQCVHQPPRVHRGSIPSIADGVPVGVPVTQAGNVIHPREGRSLSFSAMSNPGTPLTTPQVAGSVMATNEQVGVPSGVVDSSAYFIRAEQPRLPRRRTSSTNRSSSAPASRQGPQQAQRSNTGNLRHHPSSSTPYREILMFGDVEPDSISMAPRTARVWAEAAPKIASGVLKGIFIECSYTNAHGDAHLFGHLVPRHLIAELSVLADMVYEARKEREKERMGRKRKRGSRHVERERNSHSRGGVAFDSDERDESKRSRSAGRSIDDRAVTRTRQRSQQQQHQQQQHQQNTFTIATGVATANGVGSDQTMSDAAPDSTHPNSRSMTPPAHPTASSSSNPPTGPQAQAVRNAWARSKSSSTGTNNRPTTPSSAGGVVPSSALRKSTSSAVTIDGGAGDDSSVLVDGYPLPLDGITVVVIHIKDTLCDGPPVSEQVLAELKEHEAALRLGGRGLGCEFKVASEGDSFWF